MTKRYIKTLAVLLMLIAGAGRAMAANPLEALGGIVSSLTSTDKFEVSDLCGTWSYQSPAVSFESDQALGKIGGTAASVAIEDKLKPYYERLGITSMTIAVDANAGFKIKLKRITLSGTVEKDGDNGNLVFNFNGLGKMKSFKLAARARKSATNVLSLTFDISKLVAIADKVASVANIATIKTAVGLLKSYDGIYAGAKLKKTSDKADTGAASDTKENAIDKNSAAEALKGIINSRRK